MYKGHLLCIKFIGRYIGGYDERHDELEDRGHINKMSIETIDIIIYLFMLLIIVMTIDHLLQY